jgi:hypothetical protein
LRHLKIEVKKEIEWGWQSHRWGGKKARRLEGKTNPLVHSSIGWIFSILQCRLCLDLSVVPNEVKWPHVRVPKIVAISEDWEGDSLKSLFLVWPSQTRIHGHRLYSPIAVIFGNIKILKCSASIVDHCDSLSLSLSVCVSIIELWVQKTRFWDVYWPFQI